MANQLLMWDLDHGTKVTYETLAIKGSMQTVEYYLSNTELVQFKDDDEAKRFVKQELAKLVAKQIMENQNLVSFVKSEDYNRGITRYKARFCLVPGEMVQEMIKLNH